MVSGTATATGLDSECVAATAADDTSERFPHLPAIVERPGGFAPAAPTKLEETGVSVEVLRDLALKLAYTVPSLKTNWAAEQLCLPLQLTEEIYWALKQDRLVEILGQQGHFNYTYAATGRGREHAAQLFEICAYVGPAPVSLQAYSDLLEWQNARWPRITFERVQRVLGNLVLPEDAVQVAALAASAGRSLFLFGPAGNGKTSVGRMLHKALEGDLWIPHSISVGSTVIRLFDRECHRLISDDNAPPRGLDRRSGSAERQKEDKGESPRERRMDRRWLRVERPLIVAGGEMTIEELDLVYSPALRFYEAPPHVKANGGLFLIDDLGRQRVDPHQLLNRWIIPLEHGFDHLALNTGQKIQIPFRLLLAVATNLTVSDVADPAFLRRMGYRLHLDRPDEAAYAKIFHRYAACVGLEAPGELVEEIVQRYRAEGRDLRSSEPRDLIERARDICVLHQRPFELNREIMNIAWRGYFGNT